jgi:3-phosphoshikimate 1-carboxyvinyltransferase
MIYKVSKRSQSNQVIRVAYLPSSKSISNRLLLLNVLSGSGVVPENVSESDDTKVMRQALDGNLEHVDVGAAGTSMRFLTAYLARTKGVHTITGSERMKQRPITLLVDALRSLGAEIEYVEKEGYPPLRIKGGNLTSGVIELDGSVSSQYISALLMIAPQIEGGLTMRLMGKINSRPYIAMTLELMSRFGAKYEWKDNQIVVSGGGYTYSPIRVESDWSAASYWYAIASLTPGREYVLEGLERNSLQGDSAVVQIAAGLGVETVFTSSGIIIKATGKTPENYIYDFSQQPDLAQTFVVLCCLLGVRFSFTGLESLKIKETDRITALITELRKVGYILMTNDTDTIEWNGDYREKQSTAVISTYKDHRMAMAFAPIAFVMGDIKIDDPMVVTKSYPRYWEDFSLVADVETIEEAE